MEEHGIRPAAGAALFAGIMAVLSQFTFPVGVVPITLQTFVCAFAGGVLGRKWGAISIGVWLLLGLFGVPVLTMGKAGPGIFLSPVGGYYLGFVIMAWVSGFRLAEKGHFLRQIICAMAGLFCCYALGTAWFMLYFRFGLAKEMSLLTALTMTVFPFIAFDGIKVLLGVILGTRIRQALDAAGFSKPGQQKTSSL
ncbi:MAG: biotin transporter BioY [Dialister sp.]|nr:biotin transporter BioY [Dialister sp.]